MIPLISLKTYPNVRTTNYIVKIQKIDYFPSTHSKEKNESHTLGTPWYTLHYFPMLLSGIKREPPHYANHEHNGLSTPQGKHDIDHPKGMVP